MERHLYFVCPTDHLESVINDRFEQENYFCSSLGNSIRFYGSIVAQINKIIATKNITEITFILSDNNQIVMDALSNRDFPEYIGLRRFYNEILQQKRRSKLLWQTDNLQVPILSAYLNMKIAELQPKIRRWMKEPIKINGKLYYRKQQLFKELHFDFLCGNNFSLN